MSDGFITHVPCHGGVLTLHYPAQLSCISLPMIYYIFYYVVLAVIIHLLWFKQEPTYRKQCAFLWCKTMEFFIE